ncbi:PREDICTED: male accessory gland serine protease inhibitor-like [Bactrocera latifrons]|uniref:male accessory gland serine protease inhibitor-like n=1 Tax=Bactrocera latifrons TaxID=174628 RepID=UPI0008DC6C5F|nr:PREDICTED: male accessory gland serine protease inhibitor-like [Bactrocera latifrons]
MNFFAVILAAFAVIGCALALKDPICGQEHSADGNGLIKCAAYVPSWTFDAANNNCLSYVYGGCGGNDNRFPTQEACEQKCKE